MEEMYVPEHSVTLFNVYDAGTDFVDFACDICA